MGIRFFCEHCHQQLNVKAHQAGEEGVCPKCQQPIFVPAQSTVLSKAEAATRNRKKAERRARQQAIEDDQKTHANFSGTHEFDELTAQHSTQIKTAAEVKAEAAKKKRIRTSGQQSGQANSSSVPASPDRPPNKGNFLLDKPVNPWLEPNAPNPVETGLKKIWYVRHPKAGEDGPIKGKEIARMLNDKKIVAGCYVWREDWEDWIRAELVFRELMPVQGTMANNRLFTDANAPIPKSYQRKANAKANARKRKQVIGVVAIVVGLVTIGLLVWLLTTMW